MPDLAQLTIVVDSENVVYARYRLEQLLGISVKVQDVTQKVTTAARAQGAQFQTLTGFAGQLIGVFTALATVREGVDQAFASDRLEKGFANILQDAEAGRAVLQQLKDYSENSQFTFPGIADSARQLMSLGMSADQAVRTIKAVGDQLETIGSDQTNIQSIVTQLQRMLETGQANMYVFRSLAAQGIPAVQYLAQALGVDMQRAYQLLRTGAVSGQDAVTVLTYAMEANARGAVDTQKTYTQLWQELKNNVAIALGKVTEEFLKQADAATFLQALINGVRYLGQNTQVLLPILKDIAAVLTIIVAYELASWLLGAATAALSLLSPLRSVYAMLVFIGTAKVGDIIPSLNGIQSALSGVYAAAKPVLVIFAALAAIEFARYLVDQVAWIRKAVDTGAEHMLEAWEGIKTAAEILWATLKNIFKSGVNDLITSVETIPLLATQGGALGSGATFLLKQYGLDPTTAIQGLEALRAAIGKPLSAGELLSQVKGKVDDFAKNMAALKVGLQNDLADIDKEFAKPEHNQSFSQFLANDLKGAMDQVGPILKAGSDELDKFLVFTESHFGSWAKTVGSSIQSVLNRVNAFTGAALSMASARINQVKPQPPLGEPPHIQPQFTEQFTEQMDKMLGKVEQETKFVSLTTLERQKQLQVYQLLEQLEAHGVADTDKAYQILVKYNQELTKLQALQQIHELAQGLAQDFANAFGEFITGAKNAKQAVMDLAKAIEQTLVKQLVEKPITEGLTSLLSGLGGAAYGALTGSIVTKTPTPYFGPNPAEAKGDVFQNATIVQQYTTGGMTHSPSLTADHPMLSPYARGGVMDRMLEVKPYALGGVLSSMPMNVNTPSTFGIPSSQVMAYANGGVFGEIVRFEMGGGLDRGSIYDSPTLFPMAGGRTGMLGEAGPEAIIPLSRGADGKLGVAGGHSETNNSEKHYHFNMNISTPDADSFRRSRRQMAGIMQQLTRD